MRIYAAPSAMVSVVPVDAKTGERILTAFALLPRPPPGCEPWPQTVVPDAFRFVAGGKSLDFSRGGAKQVFHFMCDRWPIPPRLKATLTVRAPGYVTWSGECAVRPVGSAHGPQRVALRRKGPVGRVRFKLLDVHDTGVGPIPLAVQILPADNPPFMSPVLHLALDGKGVSPRMLLACGRWKIQGTISNGRRAFGTGNFTLSPGEDLLVPLHLISGGIQVRVRDVDGEDLDDIGVRWRPASEHEVQEIRTDHGVTLRGFFYRRPGLGAASRVSRIGLRPGPWIVEIYRHGYRPVQRSIDVEPGLVSRLDFRMQRTAKGNWDRLGH